MVGPDCINEAEKSCMRFFCEVVMQGVVQGSHLQGAMLGLRMMVMILFS
jgi:hypothetical protein